MTAKDYMKKVRKLNKTIALKEAQIQKLIAYNAPADISTVDPNPKVQKSSSVQSAASVSERIMTIKQQIQTEINKQSLFRAEALIKVLHIEDERLQEVLFLYYFEGKDWQTIAEEMKCTDTTIWNFHGQALRALKIE